MTDVQVSPPEFSGGGPKIHSHQLKHQQIEAEIRHLADTLPIGARLPAERDLAVTYGCNFLTVRKALKRLVDEGTIVRRIGSGTFVARTGSPVAPRGTRIGVLVCQDSNTYAYRLLQSVARAGLQQDVQLRSAWIRDFQQDALLQAASFQKDGYSGLVLPWFPHEMAGQARAFIKKCPLPVSIAALIPELEDNCFESAAIFGSTTEVEDVCHYYRSLGRQRIALIGPDTVGDVILEKKVTAFVRYMSRENVPSLCGLVQPGARAMDHLVQQWKEYRGDLSIVSYDDEHALRFMIAMHKIGFKAPEDYSVIGFNDTEASRYSDPPLTTIQQNFDYIAHWLLRNALALAEGRVCQSAQIPRHRILVRSTCGGRSQIDDAFRSRIPHLELIVEGEDSDSSLLQPQAAIASEGA